MASILKKERKGGIQLREKGKQGSQLTICIPEHLDFLLITFLLKHHQCRQQDCQLHMETESQHYFKYYHINYFTLVTGSRCESDPIPDVAIRVSSSLPMSQTCTSPENHSKSMLKNLQLQKTRKLLLTHSRKLITKKETQDGYGSYLGSNKT